MHIKEVETLTGLTENAIHLYEENGLITIKDDDQYTAQDVDTLNKIKVLYHIGLSIEAIKGLLLQDDDNLMHVLDKHIEKLSLDSMILTTQKDFAKKLRKKLSFNQLSQELGVVDDLYKSTVYPETSILTCVSIWRVIGASLACLAFMVLPFIFLHLKEYDKLLVSILVAMLFFVLFVWQWVGYFKQRSDYRQITRAKNKKEWYLIPAFILFFILQIILMASVQFFVATFLLSDDVFFAELPRIVHFIINMINIAGIAGLFLLFKRIVFEKKAIPKKWIFLGVLVWGLGNYIAMTQAVAVTHTQVIFYSPFNINNKVYAYRDIKYVDAYIVGSDSFQGIFGNAGDFQYKLTMNDGNTAVFSQPLIIESNERYKGIETYLELEDFDAVLVQQGVTKRSSLAHIDKVKLDIRYKERFRRIIENK